LPFRLLAMGTPKVAYAMASRLMAEGLLTTVAMVPGPAGPRPALRLQPTLAQTLEELQAMVEAVAQHLPVALAEAGSSHDALCEAFGLTKARPSGETIDIAAWRTGRSKTKSHQ
jgi:hypothetical protein